MTVTDTPKKLPVVTTRSTGVVRSWKDSFGFITDDQPGLVDIFAHYRNIRPVPGIVHRALCGGQRVSYAIAFTGKGLVAMDIVPIL